MCDYLQIVYYLLNEINIMAEEYSCPYCESIFQSKEDMSKHIDRIHGDSGILEGAK
jgi:hypothetical protein